MGIVSSLGFGLEETFQSLKSCNSGIAPITHLSTVHKNDFVAGEIKNSTSQLAEICGKPGLNRTVLLSIMAAREALKQAGKNSSARTGLISSTTVGGMTNTELQYKNFIDGKNFPPFIEEHFSGKSFELQYDPLH